jgi:hypothetical protein
MVSRILLASPWRAMAFLFLLAAVMFFAPGTQAKNPYQMSDYTEGDPGDGVLNPDPNEGREPEPAPQGFSAPAFYFILIDLGNNQFLPVFQVSNFSGTPVFMMDRIRTWTISEGRWHRAP